jgi:hypothetical protein
MIFQIIWPSNILAIRILDEDNSRNVMHTKLDIYIFIQVIYNFVVCDAHCDQVSLNLELE